MLYKMVHIYGKFSIYIYKYSIWVEYFLLQGYFFKDI